MKKAPSTSPPDNMKNMMSPVNRPPLPLNIQLVSAIVNMYAKGICHVIYLFQNRYSAPARRAKIQISPIHPALLPMNKSHFEIPAAKSICLSFNRPSGVAPVTASAFHLGFCQLVIYAGHEIGR